MIDLDNVKNRFKNHVAIFTNYGNIKILDFKKPNTNFFHIRFLFDEEYYKLYISGDLGELIATNCTNMTYEHFKDFVNSPQYFEEKVDCHSKKIYKYNEEKARKDLLELIEELKLEEAIYKEYWFDTEEEAIIEFSDAVLYDFNNETGIGGTGFEIASNLIDDFYEVTEVIGKEKTGVLEVYMLAFKLATEQLEKENN